MFGEIFRNFTVGQQPNIHVAIIQIVNLKLKLISTIDNFKMCWH